MIAPDVPRKRTLAAFLLACAALGAGAATIDRARGIPPSADRIFTEPPVTLQSRPGTSAAAPFTSTGGAAAISGATK